jgi:large subunit ribosomal protein L21
MKKAVIQTGSKQYLVKEGEVLHIELIRPEGKTATFEPLLVIDDAKIEVGTPTLASHKVIAEVVADNEAMDKVTAIRFKAKKRVHKVHGHRQHMTAIKVTSIA